jgi:hypothetical protein
MIKANLNSEIGVKICVINNRQVKMYTIRKSCDLFSKNHIGFGLIGYFYIKMLQNWKKLGAELIIGIYDEVYYNLFITTTPKLIPSKARSPVTLYKERDIKDVTLRRSNPPRVLKAKYN